MEESNKIALITGIAGQDGSYLAELLLSLGYKVHGTIRRNSTPENQENRIHHLESYIETYYADLTDSASILKVLTHVKPTHIFNLAAQSHVRISFDIPLYTSEVNAFSAIRLFDLVKQVCPEAKVYQASSSEMFGTSVDIDGFQRESTTMHPASPYGIAKLFAFNAAKTYRDSYGVHISNGILFNHESPRRGSNFVTSKIVKGAIDISRGKFRELSLGNIEAQRDWGHSRDYVQAMVKILDLDEPCDLVIATGETRSVRDLCRIVFSELGMNWEDHVKIDPKFFRPKEVPLLKGDASLARSKLLWKPETSFENLVLEMIKFWSEEVD